MITSALNAALSGLDVASRKLEVSANNLANLNTDGFQAQRLTEEELPTGGVRVGALEPTGAPAPQLIQPDGMLVAGSNTDIVQEIVSQIAALHSYRMNLATVRTTDEMTGELLKIKV